MAIEMRKSHSSHDITGLVYKGTEWSDEEQYKIDTRIEDIKNKSNAQLGVIRQGQIEREWKGKPLIEIKVIIDSKRRKRLFFETATRNSKKESWTYSGLYESKADIWYIEFYNLDGVRENILLTSTDIWRLRAMDGVEVIGGNGIRTGETGQYKRGYSIPYDCLMIYYQQKFGFTKMTIDRNESRTEYNKL